ncbi:histone-lysine N-methyltransferase [Trifolium pratense]|uniref:Histone-lysine N-methyltransferase n=1 Tax=Trifolium pratense TaxID=57577 RepID=A0A2K3P7S0_TRIPR|nr:histone-lysine N-methyltransferase [Trifolium pratense]
MWRKVKKAEKRLQNRKGVDKNQNALENDANGKRMLWRKLSDLVGSKPRARWCVMGDFNAIKSESERKRVRDLTRVKMVEFENFMSEAELIDLPLIGRRFTWSNLEGSAMSHIDMFLFSEGYLNGQHVLNGVWTKGSQIIVQSLSVRKRRIGVNWKGIIIL